MNIKFFIFSIILFYNFICFSKENNATFLSPFSDGTVGYYAKDRLSEYTYGGLHSLSGLPIFLNFALISRFSEGVAVAVRSDSDFLISYLLYSNGDSILLGNIFPVDLDNFAFSENLIPMYISKINKCGFINKYGAWIIPPMYSSARSFSNGLAPVQEPLKNGRWGYINSKNELIIPYKYKKAKSFSTDRIAAVMNLDYDSWNFIDINGKELNTDTYYRVGDFVDGLCPVLKNVHDSACYIDFQGNEYFKGKFKMLNSFSEGLAAVSIDGEKFGYINRNGEIMILPQYYFVIPFKNGHTIVCTQTQSVADQIINTRGEVVLDIKTFQKRVEKYKKEHQK